MPIKWRAVGEPMGTVDLRELKGEQVVLHFGGTPSSVDAYTFANSLISFADTIRAINATLDPSQKIEVRLEAVGPGSFRAVVKRVTKSFGGFLGRGVENVFFMFVGAVLLDATMEGEKFSVEITDDLVVIRKGNDRVIMPREVYEQSQIIKQDPAVRKNVRNTFQVIENDPAIDNFGMTPRIQDEEPTVQIPREEFPRLAVLPELTAQIETESRKYKEEEAVLIILKVWLKPGTSKWSFEWNGVPITAPIMDQTFWKKIEDREYLIGSGDALRVVIAYWQIYDDELGLFVNDTSTFQVRKVLELIRRGDQGRLLND